MAPIPGTLSLDHVKENLAALSIALDEDEFEALTVTGHMASRISHEAREVTKR